MEAILGFLNKKNHIHYVLRGKFLEKKNKRDVPNKGVMNGKSSEIQINVQHVY